MTKADTLPIVFLAGPPGSGKTTLGSKACSELGVRFLDLPAVKRDGLPCDLSCIREAASNRVADVVALPSEVQQIRSTLAECRKLGRLIALWAHPIDMQARSGRSDQLFTPSKRLKTQGGFGQLGTACTEYRRLERACDEVLLLVGMIFDEAVGELKVAIEDYRQPEPDDPAEREGIAGWGKHWTDGGEYRGSRHACEVLENAMARFTLHLKEEGAPPRKMSGVYSDLDAAGMLLFMYERPTATNVLTSFDLPPFTYEFRRKFSDSPRALSRYEKNLSDFASFLVKAGLIEE